MDPNNDLMVEHLKICVIYLFETHIIKENWNSCYLDKKKNSLCCFDFIAISRLRTGPNI